MFWFFIIILIHHRWIRWRLLICFILLFELGLFVGVYSKEARGRGAVVSGNAVFRSSWWKQHLLPFSCQLPPHPRLEWCKTLQMYYDVLSPAPDSRPLGTGPSAPLPLLCGICSPSISAVPLQWSPSPTPLLRGLWPLTCPPPCVHFL